MSLQQLTSAYQPFITATWEKIERKISRTAPRIADSFPYTTRDGVYNNLEHTNLSWWTNTFWAGVLWEVFKETGEESYKSYAQSIERKMDATLLQYDGLHHDVGFMWLMTSGYNYKLTGDEQSRRRLLLTASLLASRFNLSGGYIRAWNGDHHDLAIIDCMMNIPLLFWASELSKDDRFKQIGMRHADTTIRAFVRPDGSVNHIVRFDPATGEVRETPGGQGIASGSSWARGQSWAVYGFAQAYHWTGKAEYLATAKKIAHYVLAALPAHDFVPPCDFRQPADSNLKDSSAGAIAACGLIEIAKALPEEEQALYLDGAVTILQALEAQCTAWDSAEEALLTHGTSAYHDGNRDHYGFVHNGALIYGDYYFIEALGKLKALL